MARSDDDDDGLVGGDGSWVGSDDMWVTIFGSLAKICGVGDYLGLDLDIRLRFGVGH